MSTVPTNPPSNPVPGAVYIDIATNTAYVWTGNGWVASGGSTGYSSQITTGAAILPGYFAEPTPESFITAVGTEPTNPGEGQIWVDDSVTPSPVYVWHNNAWKKISDGTFTDTTVASVPPATPDTGDTYWETSTSRFYVWDGSAWTLVSDPTISDTHSIYTSIAPTTRISGASLVAGDMWVDSDDGATYYWNGSSWNSIASVGGTDTHSFYTSVAPTTRNDGSSLLAGDMWIDSGTGIAYVWTGSAFTPISSTSSSGDTHGMAMEINGSPQGVITTRTDGSSLQQGDQFVDRGTNTLYYYNLANTTWSAIGGGTSATTDTQGMANEGRPGNRYDGSALQLGDHYSETSVDPKNAEYYFRAPTSTSGVTEWKSGASSILEGAGAPTATVRVSGASLVENDIYIDESTGNLYRWDSAAWQQLATSTSTIGTYYQSTIVSEGAPNNRLDGGAFLQGDMIVDTNTTSGHVLESYVYTTPATTAAFAHMITSGTGVPDIFSGRYAGARHENDLYIDESTGDLYRYDLGTASWVQIGG